MKKFFLLIGVTAFFAVTAVWANDDDDEDHDEDQEEEPGLPDGGGGNPDPNKWTKMSISCYDKYGQKTGNRICCFASGFSLSCTSTSCK